MRSQINPHNEEGSNLTTIATATPRTLAGLVRWAKLGGVAYVVLWVIGVILLFGNSSDSGSAPAKVIAYYVVLWVIGVILLFGNSPDSGSAPAKVIAYYSDSGHRTRMNIGWVLAGLGLFFFLWYLSALRRTIRRLEGDDGL